MNDTATQDDARGKEAAVVDRLGLLKVGGAALAGGAAIAGIEAVSAGASVAPDSPAAGSLAGVYANPTIVPLAIVDSMVSSSTAIAESKLDLAADGAQATPCRRTIGSGRLQAKPGIPIAVGNYSGAPANYSRTAPFTTVAAVDSTNLKVTFTAPDTGAVLVTLNAPVNVSTSGTYIAWALMEGGSTLSTGIGRLTNSTSWLRQEAQFRISGLTPGSSHTYTWGWYGSGSAGTISMSAVSIWGFATMVVARCA
jgi:hypothetical protein